MILAGMNVARLNMSHGDEISHGATLSRIRQAADEMSSTVAVMIDTKGREIRTGKLSADSVLLERNQSFSILPGNQQGNENGVSVSHPNLYQHAKHGERILLDDGQIELIVTDIVGNEIQCRVECGGVLRETKGVNLPDNNTAFNDIPSNDNLEINFAAENDVQYIAASFIRNASEVVNMRNQLKERVLIFRLLQK